MPTQERGSGATPSRRELLLAGLLAAADVACGTASAAGKPGTQNPPKSRPQTSGEVERWGVYEVTLRGPETGNPFVDVSFGATFQSQGRRVKVDGFYDGDGTYRVRFMPDVEGEWTYVTHGNAEALDGREGRFVCVTPAPDNHGPVYVRNTHHFGYADGTPYLPIGTTCYAWTHQEQSLQEQTLSTLRDSPFNKLRMCIFPKDYAYNDVEPPLYPFVRDAGGKSDFSRFDPAFWRHFEQRVGELGALGIEADIILFHPYDHGRWGYSTMSPEADDRYLRYAIARLAAYRNVWWSLANEAVYMKKPEDHWDRSFRIVQESDPYQHLRSIHGSADDPSVYPITHASSFGLEPRKALEWRKAHAKPLVFDEVGYEGNVAAAWGDLTAEEFVKRVWQGTMLGGYVGHGETYLHPKEVIWWSKGGVLRGDSPARIAFLRRILEEGPQEGLEPISVKLSPWFRGEATLAGKEGEYYLHYLGAARPKELHLALPSGGPYSIEIIDTWEMKITPVPGTYKGVDTIKNTDRSWRWEGMVTVKMPGQPYQALRFRRVG